MARRGAFATLCVLKRQLPDWNGREGRLANKKPRPENPEPWLGV